jgi:hypothetical protein
MLSDPKPLTWKPSPLALTQEEVDEIKFLAAKGDIPADALEQCRKAAADLVFGVGHKVDANGKPIENGVGSKGHENLNHFLAIKKYEGDEKYWAALREIWKRDPARAKAIGLEPPPTRPGGRL